MFRLVRVGRVVKTQLFSPKVSCLQHRYYNSDAFDNMNINIKPIHTSDATAFKKYTVDDYSKDVLKMTSFNLLKIGGFTSFSILAVAPVLLNYVDALPLGVCSVIGGTGVALYSLYQISKETPQLVKLNPNRADSEYEIQDSTKRKIHLNTFLLAEAIVISPVVSMCIDFVPSALAITGGLMIAPIVTAYALPKNSMLPLGNALMTGLCGMIAISLVGLFVPSFGHIWFEYEPWLGIGLFSLFNAYDTQVMLNSYEQRKLDPMGHSINYTLNFINIFIRVLEILAKSKNGQNK